MTTDKHWLGLMCELCFNEIGPLTYDNSMVDSEGQHWDAHRVCEEKDLENARRVRAERLLGL